MSVSVTAISTDADLEREIDAAFEAGMKAAERAKQASPEDARLCCDEARSCFRRMARLIARRSPERVAEMEREKGLR